jgi:hypothetical protein
MEGQTNTDRLEGLASMAQEVDGAHPTAEQQQAEQVAAQALSAAEQGAREWGVLMFAVGGFATMIAPELRPVYSQERCLDWGQHAQQVCEKYGWTGPSNMPEVALIASTIGFAVPTYMVVSQKMGDLKTSKDGTWLQKAGAWWRNRKAKKAQPVAPEQAAGAADGVQQ